MKLTVNCRFTQLISLLILFVLPEIGMSQDQDIDSCTSAEVVDVDHQKAMDFYFKHNINISAYDWSNTNVNCHIALGYKSNAQKNMLLRSGIATLCLGAIVLGSGMVWGVTADPEKKLDGSDATTIIGAGICACGVVLWHLSWKPKWESKYHIREVNYYFSE
ncbi:MAG TPA: hypothetical protein VE978_03785 [Chitinophagales bacterium]|nr:hypothetical protein [Chitinophagales bacterium]